MWFLSLSLLTKRLIIVSRFYIGSRRQESKGGVFLFQGDFPEVPHNALVSILLSKAWSHASTFLKGKLKILILKVLILINYSFIINRIIMECIVKLEYIDSEIGCY